MRRLLLATLLAGSVLGLAGGGPLVVGATDPPAGGAGPDQVVTLAPERGGQDVVGRKFAALPLRWAGAEPESAKPAAVTLYRWWTDSCRHCRASLPAIERLRKRYGSKGLRVVAVFHPKPPGPVDDERVRRLARSRGYEGPVAIDAEWSRLRRAYLDHGQRNATSVAMLVDAKGVVRFVHPGPAFFPSTDPAHATANADYQALEQAIRVLVLDQGSAISHQPSGEAKGSGGGD